MGSFTVLEKGLAAHAQIHPQPEAHAADKAQQVVGLMNRQRRQRDDHAREPLWRGLALLALPEDDKAHDGEHQSDAESHRIREKCAHLASQS